MKKLELGQFVLKMTIIGIGVGCIAVGVHMFYGETLIRIYEISIPVGLVLSTIGLIIIAMGLRLPNDTRGRRGYAKVGYGTFLIPVVFFAVYILTRYTLPEGSQYTILKDLILIILAFTGAVGYVAFRWIHKSVENQVAIVTEEGRSFTNAQTQASLGFWHFEQYRAENKKKTEMDGIEARLTKIESHQGIKEDSKIKNKSVSKDAKYCLNKAIEKTERAMEFMKELDEKKYEEPICVYKNNLAYFFAERKKNEIDQLGDKEVAKDYADYIQKRIGKYPDHKKEFADTCDFVNKQFPRDVG